MSDAELKFRHAEAFVHAAGIVSEHAVTRAYLVPPVIVCRAFAFELFLKCLIELEGGNYPKKHTLRLLFNLLSSTSQVDIKSRSIVCCAQWGSVRAPEPNPDKALDMSSEAFERFRYWFEPDYMGQSSWLADSLLRGIRDRLVMLKPDWELFLDDPNAPLPQPPSPTP